MQCFQILLILTPTRDSIGPSEDALADLVVLINSGWSPQAAYQLVTTCANLILVSGQLCIYLPLEGWGRRMFLQEGN